jgi:hypothetical protein
LSFPVVETPEETGDAKVKSEEGEHEGDEMQDNE